MLPATKGTGDVDLASPRVRQALADFCARHDLTLMVLFGSRAKGHATPRSDIDLAVLSRRRDLDVEYQETVWEELLALLSRGDVDLVWLNHALPLLAFQVATSGPPGLSGSSRSAPRDPGWPRHARRSGPAG